MVGGGSLIGRPAVGSVFYLENVYQELGELVGLGGQGLGLG